LELGKSGSYIRGITSGATLPSVRELFNIMDYFEITPSEFFIGLENTHTLRIELEEKLRELSEDDLKKVSLFISWIQ
jgi:transcriptional regulator with XRE-family HTH domain